MKRFFATALLSVALSGATATAVADNFTRAWLAVERAGHISPAIKKTWADSPLYSELVAEATEKQLGRISAQNLEALIAQYPDSVAIANLRWRKLFRLGRANWHEDYLFLFRPTDSVELNCYALEAKMALGRDTESDRRAAVQLWTHGRSQPDACDPLFAKLEQRGLLTDEVRLRRIDRALASNQLSLARWLARPLDQTATGHINAWDIARRDPERYFKTKAREFPEWAEMAGNRLARTDAAKMMALLEDPDFPDLAKPEATLGAALTMALDKDPAAARLLSQSLPAHPVLDVWRVRYFIDQENWPQVLNAIARLSPDQQRELEWTYWTSRALAMTGSPDLAQAGFIRVAESNSWYGFLAADYLGLPYQFAPKSTRPPQAIVDRVAARTDVVIAQLLFQEGLTVMARRQWDFVLGRLTEVEQQAAAVLANQWNWYSRSAVTAHQSGLTDDYELRYPLAHQNALTRAADAHGLSLSFLSGLMRSESLFMHDIRSPAGALGLMQVMPRTGRQVAKRLNIRWRGTNTLINPSLNVRIGSFYLADQMDRFGHPALAAAAYNAGPHRVEQWLPERPKPLDVWVASVPFSETRNYIQRVLGAQVIYEWRYTGRPVRLEALADAQIVRKE